MVIVFPTSTIIHCILYVYIPDTDDCSPNPCLNEGVCTDQLNAFSCACVAGWEGSTCETGKLIYLLSNMLRSYFKILKKDSTQSLHLGIFI